MIEKKTKYTKNNYNVKMLFSIYVVLLFGFLFQSVLADNQKRGLQLNPIKHRVETPYTNGVYRALIIGNSKYDDIKKRWASLNTAVTDAKAVAALLKSNYGFTDIIQLENASRRDTLRALNTLSKRVRGNDSVLVYYAGHGFLDSDTQKGYWIPVDAEGLDNSTFLRNSTIRDELSIIASRSKHTLLISDSCFSGALLRNQLRGKVPSTNTENYYKKVASKKSVQIIAAGGLEYVDDNYKKSGHSPFSYFLLNELKFNDQLLLTASELSSNVQKAVANNVDQIPTSGVLQGAGDEMGEFIFLNLNITVDVKGVPNDKVKVEINRVSAGKMGKATPKNIEIITADENPSHSNTDKKQLFYPLPTL